MDMKKLIQQMTDIESSAKQKLTESTLEECGDAMPAQTTNPGNPVTMSVTLNASGKDHVADLIDMMKNAGLEKAGPVQPEMMSMRQDMERLRAIVDEPAESVNSLNDSELEEAVDTKEMMGQIRKMAKGVETSPDDRDHRMFAQQVESKLIDLFQAFKQDMDMKKAQAVSDLIKQNKQAQQQTDKRNANVIVSALWELMNANEGYDNEPDEEYQDHNYMIKDLSGGLNREKRAYKAAQDGDNAMAVEAWKADTEGEFYDDENELTIRWMADPDSGEIEVSAFNSSEEEVSLSPKQEALYISQIEDEMQSSADDYGDYMMHKAQDDRMESIKEALYKALTEKRSKPDYLDMDKDGDKKEPMKKAIADKEKKSKKKNEVTENQAPRTQHNLMYMDKDALNSGKDRKYFLMDYEMKYGIHYPENFRRQIEEHPITIKLKDQGYVGPKQLVGWQGNIEDEIEKNEKMVDAYKGREKEFPTQYYGSKDRLEALLKAKKIIDSGNLEEDTEVDEKLKLKKGLRKFKKKNYHSSKFSFK